jgi:hypothetical protein
MSPLLQFAVDPGRLASDVQTVKADRSIADLPALLLRWLAYVWGTKQSHNPLVTGTGIPAVFVEIVCGLSRVQLMPGLSSNAACPEAIWQAAKWLRRVSA